MPGTTITTHPTHPTVARNAGPAKRGQSRKDRHGEAGENACPRVAIRSSATLLIEQRRGYILLKCAQASMFHSAAGSVLCDGTSRLQGSHLTMQHGCYAIECDSGILLRFSAAEWSAPYLGLDRHFARQQQFAHPVLLKRSVLPLPS